MAVDRSKFRTCEQTSFCKRHRSSRSKPAFEYAIIPQSIHIHVDSNVVSTADAADTIDTDTDIDTDTTVDTSTTGGVNVEQEDPKKTQKVGVYQQIKRMLQTKRHDNDNDNDNDNSKDIKDEYDPNYRGAKPFFTATLMNKSKRSYYPHKYSTNAKGNANDNDEEDIPQERLNLFLYLHHDGVARMRITEQYTHGYGTSSDSAQKPFAKPRWTSDELILNLDEIKGVDHASVQILSFPQIQPLLHHIPSLHQQENRHESIQEENYIAFQYGNIHAQKTNANANANKKHKNDAIPIPNANANAIVLVQFQPFAIHMWRTNDNGGIAADSPPFVSFNADQLMHFEVRRDKVQPKQEKEQEHVHSGENGNSDEVEQDITDTDVDPNTAHDKHGGKEIVGYWEDGLAIYADGTREEKDTAAHAQQDPPEPEVTVFPTEGFQIDTDGMWQEKFGDHEDSKPYGPTSIGADISFPSSNHLFGLPEHASSMQLRDTTATGAGDDAHYKEPYRLYNLDVFEYELDENMALYGEVPLIISQSATTGTSGVFWFNPSETFVDVETVAEKGSGAGMESKTHWMSESGIIDLFFLPGPDPRTIYEQYARLTGRVELPPMFSLGYHQCRWNYRDEADVYQVHDKFEELDYPYDVLWLDIEHTDGKRYFTWDKNQFPNPIPMQEKLSGQGRKMVTIVDPHIKRDDKYYIHKEATAKGLYIKDKTGKKDYDGWCWPGSSSYLDFTSEKVRSWWADQFAYNRYSGSTPSLYTWNDMNEPSVFNGPEVSMQKDLRNLEGVEHREWHNLYGILFQRATAEGLVRRNKGENIRPFVLSRSFFAGSQRYGAIWTGDNESSWEHLKIAVPMLLSLNIGALSFVGADVGGFFGNPDAELMTRWMQAGAYQPFFRGHAHHDAKRREPWMFGEESMVRMRRAAMARYALLPYWYTVFREASVSGMPVMR